MVTSNDPTLVVSSKPCQSAQTSKTSEHAHIYIYINVIMLNFILFYLGVLHDGNPVAGL